MPQRTKAGNKKISSTLIIIIELSEHNSTFSKVLCSVTFADCKIFTMAKRGIVLMNLGSPDSTSVKDVRRYLKEFLMDERVIDVPFLLRAFFG